MTAREDLMAQAGDMLTPAEVSQILHVDAKTVTRWAKSGKLRTAAVTPGGHRRYSAADVSAMLTGGGQ